MQKLKEFFKGHKKKEMLDDLLHTESAKSIIASLICILGGVLVGFVVLFLIALFTPNIPFSDAFRGLFIILGGPFASGSGNVMMILGDTLLESVPLIMTGLSVAIAFKTGLFNIGAPGQYLMGAMTALIIALSIDTTTCPAFFVWVLAFLAGTAVGALWGAIPGLFKAFLNVNEVIVCIMTNWIAANIVSWVFRENQQFVNVAETKMNFVKPTSKNGVMTWRMGLDKIFEGSNIDCSIFLVILIAIGIYILINKTTLGYELKACGYNKHAAKYAGMNEKRNIVLSMMIAGALAAAGAALWFLNGKNDFRWDTYQSLPDTGFNGIPVALLASNNPIGVIFSALLLRYIGKGGFNLAGFTSFNEYVSNLIIAMIIYFSCFSKFIRDLMDKKRKDRLEKASLAAASVGTGDGGIPSEEEEESTNDSSEEENETSDLGGEEE